MHITQGKFEFNNLRFTDMPEWGNYILNQIFLREAWVKWFNYKLQFILQRKGNNLAKVVGSLGRMAHNGTNASL